MNSDKKTNTQKLKKKETVFEIDDAPENEATALIQVNPKEECFEWEYLKSEQHVEREKMHDRID